MLRFFHRKMSRGINNHETYLRFLSRHFSRAKMYIIPFENSKGERPSPSQPAGAVFDFPRGIPEADIPISPTRD